MRFIKDINDIPSNISVAIYGTGSAGKEIKDRIENERKDISIKFFLDSFKSGVFEGYELIKFNPMKEYQCDLILIASSYWNEIEKKINNLNSYNTVHPHFIKPIGYLHGNKFEPYTINHTYRGKNYKYFIGDYIGEEWYGKGYSPLYQEIDFLIDFFLNENDVIFEAGGHHGISSLLLSNYVKRIITFEPNPKNVKIIDKNFEINSMTNITSYCKALGASSDLIKMSDRSCSTIITDFEYKDLKVDKNVYNEYMKGYQYDIEVVPLDDYIDYKPTLLKIDVEGYEVHVLKGAMEILKTLPKLEIEIHWPHMLEKHGSSVDEIFSLIDFSKYKTWIKWNEFESPKIYNGEKINDRVHLFALPLNN